MNGDAVKKFSSEMLSVMRQIEESSESLRHSCDQEEFEFLRGQLGKVAAALMDEVLNPLFTEYPEVKPAGYFL